MKTSTIETWRDVVGYEYFYQVSDAGHVKSLPRFVDGPKVQQMRKGGILRLRLMCKYGTICLYQKGLRKTFLVHRLVAAAFIGPCPVGKEVNHIDGDKINNRSSNLEYVTPSENTLHAFRTGLRKAALGVDNPIAKITESDVLKIRAAYAAGVTQRKIADNFGVSQPNISRIVHRKTWAHLPATLT